jgi:hypothetical protein
MLVYLEIFRRVREKAIIGFYWINAGNVSVDARYHSIFSLIKIGSLVLKLIIEILQVNMMMYDPLTLAS